MSLIRTIVCLMALLVLITAILFTPPSPLRIMDTFHSPLLVYKADMIPDTVFITRSYPQLHGIRWLLSGEGPRNKTLFVQDAFSYKASSDKEALCVVDQNYVFYITKSSSETDETLLSVIREKKSFWCPTKSCKELLESVVVASGGNAEDIIVETHDPSNAYAITHFEILSLKQTAVNDMIGFIDFEKDMDIHKLKIYVPIAISESIDMSLYFSNRKKDKFPVKSVLAFKTLVWMYTTHTIPSDCLGEVFDRIADVDDTNYFTLHLKFCNVAQNKLRNINKFITERDQLPILEQFQSSTNAVILEPAYNLHGFYESEKQTLNVKGDTLEGLPFDIVKKLVLTKQVRLEENGTYVVKGMTATDTVLQKIDTPQSKTSDQEYRCVGDPTIKNKGLCNSIYDASRNLKRFKTVWDKPCVENTECPFYQANKSYPNYRGGCNDGFCEMPIGVTRIGFTKYEGKPMCHGCSLSKPDCCDLQASPDFAFELDFDARNALR